MAFDLRTAVVLTIMMTVLMSVVLYSAASGYPKVVKGLREWTASTLLFAFAFVLFILRDHAPVGLTVTLGNFCYSLALVSGLAGSMRLLNVPVPAAKLITGVVLVNGLMAVNTYAVPDIMARTALISLSAALIYAMQLALVWRHGERHSSSVFLGATMAAAVLLMLMRGISALFPGHLSSVTAPITEIWDANTIQQAYAFGMSGLALLHPIGFLLIATHRMHQYLDALSSRDPLTDVLNRRAFFKQGGLDLARARRRRTGMSILVIDLDFFKRINDQFGHDTGDQVLIHFAAVVTRQHRCTDIFARFGGEEFVLLLPDTDIEQAVSMAQRIQAGIAAGLPESLPGYTCSIGVAQFGGDGETLGAIIHRADRALYRAKQNGRNRVELAAASEE